MVDDSHAGEWGLFAIYCRDFHTAARYAAARYAADRNWWLHCWEWRTDDNAPEEPVVIELR